MTNPEHRAARRLAEAERRAQLADSYVRDTITKHRDYDGHPVTEAEIQTKREQLIAWRTTTTCQCGAETVRGAIQCKPCRRAARLSEACGALTDVYVRKLIRTQAAKAGRPLPLGRVITAAEIEAKRQDILAVRARRAAAR